MTNEKIKIPAKLEELKTYYFYDKPKAGSITNQGTEVNYYHFISQETITKDGQQVPK